jgi:hypothetical protein
MAVCEDELITKMNSGASNDEICRWFLKQLIDANAEYRDLSPLELMFLGAIKHDYEKWKARRKIH